MLPFTLRHQEVGGESQRAAERRGDADRAERDPRPELDDEREPLQTHRDRYPDAPADVLLVDEPREQRDEEWRRELDEKRDADREVVDRHEVEPLHECDADEAEGDEQDAEADADRLRLRQMPVAVEDANLGGHLEGPSTARADADIRARRAPRNHGGPPLRKRKALERPAPFCYLPG